jgi:hypothetical protein
MAPMSLPISVLVAYRVALNERSRYPLSRGWGFSRSRARGGDSHERPRLVDGATPGPGDKTT